MKLNQAQLDALRVVNPKIKVEALEEICRELGFEIEIKNQGNIQASIKLPGQAQPVVVQDGIIKYDNKGDQKDLHRLLQAYSERMIVQHAHGMVVNRSRQSDGSIVLRFRREQEKPC